MCGLQNCLLNGKTLEFALRNPFDTIISSQSYPLGGRLVDVFRTLNWKQIAEELVGLGLQNRVLQPT
jgi:hypothetical protein